ncbi:MAG: hypothetical protein R3Y10_08860 [Ferrimonas sp.]
MRCRSLIATLLISSSVSVAVIAEPHHPPAAGGAAPGGRPPGLRGPDNHYGGRPAPANFRPSLAPGKPFLSGLRPHHRHIVVRPGQFYRPPARLRYPAKGIQNIATFALLAGVTYAVIDNVFYRQVGNEYVYEGNPPAGNYTVLPSTQATPSYKVGEIVAAPPASARTIVVDGISYREYDGHWFAPMGGSSQFAVVNPPI